MIDKISRLGIPVVAISLRHDIAGEQAKMNPTLADEEQAYNRGLREGITLIGDIVNKPQEAKALIEAMDKGRKMVSDRLQSVPENERVRAYMANPELTTYGSGKYTGLMMAHAGALNVAASSVKGFKQVTMEQVIAWDPQVIFVQNRYPKVVNEILHNPQWQVIDAVKHHRVYLMPDYAKAWGYPMPEAVGIGELWMAKNSIRKNSTILTCKRPLTTGINVFTVLTIRAYNNANTGCGELARRLAAANGGVSGGCGM